ncbi:NUDIX domain-containing protein [Georgenia sp. TF02-10]|uniref:NUDIX hydrolase n=1 Tax=Georgenia sp. TF02-10 TaxID=2917725 RepID=UPI001FA7DAC2|nr:NUDIX domain-containing protein [Georgenia sp. TF02-10]UNX55223.1 NUDIX domain-containing protein [Georgenia sp. TF02-10]
MPVPEFVAQLRAAVGHDLLWLPGVTGVVLDDADRVLLGRRADNGRWALVSGILEPGEQPAVGLVREIAEETGVTAEAVALAAVTAGQPMTYPNGDVSQYLDLTFLCRYVDGDARVADDESTDVGWFALSALPAGLASSSRERLDHALAFRADPSAGTRFSR